MHPFTDGPARAYLAIRLQWIYQGQAPWTVTIW